MMELNGTLRWAITVPDGIIALMKLAGCFAFDADPNGVADVLYADESGLGIFEGATGVALYENGTHGSVTMLDTRWWQPWFQTQRSNCWWRRTTTGAAESAGALQLPPPSAGCGRRKLRVRWRRRSLRVGRVGQRFI